MPTIAEQLLIDACATGFACTAQNDLSFRQSFLELLYQIQQGGGGGGTPGGAPGDVQFNNAGAFGGFGDFNSGTGALTLPGTVSAPTFIGNLTGAASLNVLKTGDTMTGPLTIVPSSANTIPLTVSGYSVTGAGTASVLDLSGTWNTTGVPTAIRLDITDTASGAQSLLMDLRVGGVSQFSVEDDGDVRSRTQIFAETALYGDSLNIFSVSNGGRIQLTSAADGFLNILPWTGTALFVRLGGTTAAFPALKRSSTALQVRLGDDSAYAPLEASTLRVATAFTVATLPAFGTAGRIAYVTDALAPAFLALAVGGGAIVTTVLDNGSAWVTV